MSKTVTDGAVLSPLALQLQSLIDQGVVKPALQGDAVFPSAFVVVPVYDSTGTGPYQSRELPR